MRRERLDGWTKFGLVSVGTVVVAALTALFEKLGIPTLLAVTGILIGAAGIVGFIVLRWPSSGKPEPRFLVQVLLGAFLASVICFKLVVYAKQPRSSLYGHTDGMAGVRVIVMDSPSTVGFGTIPDAHGNFSIQGLHDRQLYVLLYAVSGDSIYFVEYTTFPNSPADPVAYQLTRLIGAPRRDLPIIYFENGSANLDYEAERMLRNVRSWLDTGPEALLIIEGHCSRVGDPEYNQSLGGRRCASVYDFLGESVAPERLYAVSFSFRDLAKSGSSARDHAGNRRVRFTAAPRLPILEQFRMSSTR